jgi:oligopeptide transport system substrate-binding protein
MPFHMMVAQAIGQMWKQHLGIDVTFRPLERGSFGAERRQTRNFDIARGGWYGDYMDPTTWLDLVRTTDGNNDGKYSNPTFDALLEQASKEADPAKRFEILRESERLLMEEEFPLLPLYQYSDGFVFDPDKIGGIGMNVRMTTPLKWIYRK